MLAYLGYIGFVFLGKSSIVILEKSHLPNSFLYPEVLITSIHIPDVSIDLTMSLAIKTAAESPFAT